MSKLKRKHLEIGGYEPVIQADGTILWDVKLDKEGSGFLCETQEEAEILGRVAFMMEGLRKNENRRRNQKKVEG